MSSRKRADRRTNGFIPDIDRDPSKRRIVQPEVVRNWTLLEEKFCLYAICACRNRADYDTMVPRLLQIVGKPPNYPKGANPSIHKIQDDSIRAMELRVVSKILGNTAWAERARDDGIRFCEYRPQQFPTWGERVKILKPYFRKMKQYVARLHIQDAIHFFGWTQCRHQINNIIDRWGIESGDYQDECFSQRPPIFEGNQNKLKEWLYQLDELLQISRGDLVPTIHLHTVGVSTRIDQNYRLITQELWGT